MELARPGPLSAGWEAHVARRGRAGVISLALAYLDEHHDLPLASPPSREAGTREAVEST